MEHPLKFNDGGANDRANGGANDGANEGANEGANAEHMSLNPTEEGYVAIG